MKVRRFRPAGGIQARLAALVVAGAELMHYGGIIIDFVLAIIVMSQRYQAVGRNLARPAADLRPARSRHARRPSVMKRGSLQPVHGFMPGRRGKTPPTSGSTRDLHHGQKS